MSGQLRYDPEFRLPPFERPNIVKAKKKIRKVSYAKMNGFVTGYNQKPVPDVRENYKKKDNIAAAYCPECKQSFDIRLSNGKGNGMNRLSKPKYLPSGFPTISLTRALCGFDKCYNKLN